MTVCMRVRAYASTHACTYVWTGARMDVRICVCLDEYIYIYSCMFGHSPA